MNTEEGRGRFWDMVQSNHTSAFGKHHRAQKQRFLYVEPHKQTVPFGFHENGICVRLNVPAADYGKMNMFKMHLNELITQAGLPGEFFDPPKGYESNTYTSFGIKCSLNVEEDSSAQVEAAIKWLYQCWLIFHGYWKGVNAMR